MKHSKSFIWSIAIITAILFLLQFVSMSYSQPDRTDRKNLTVEKKQTLQELRTEKQERLDARLGRQKEVKVERIKTDYFRVSPKAQQRAPELLIKGRQSLQAMKQVKKNKPITVRNRGAK